MLHKIFRVLYSANPDTGGFSFDSPDAAATSAAEEILDSMPDVQEHAIRQHEQEQQEEQENNVDIDGTPFDPELHTGTKTSAGRWRKKKQSGSFVAKPRTRKSANVDSPVETQQVDVNAEAMATGTVIAQTILAMCSGIGGDEWKPTENELQFQTQAWQAYCVAKNIKEFSPGWGVVIAMGSYALPRFSKPQTQAKVGRLKTWIALRYAKWKLKKELAKRGVKADVKIVNGALTIDGAPAEQVLKRNVA